MPAQADTGALPLFVERRWVPWWWWAIVFVLVVPSVEGVIVFGPDMQTHAGWPVGIATFVVTVGLCAALLVRMSASTVLIDDDGVHAEGRTLPATAIGGVRTLDAATARAVLGVQARADAWLSIRPWIHTAVQIQVDDERMGPYWVIATRRPADLIGALHTLRWLAGGDDGDDDEAREARRAWAARSPHDVTRPEAPR